MKLGEIVVHMGNYNFAKFHQNQMKNKKTFINCPFFCSEFQSISRIVKIVHSAQQTSRALATDPKFMAEKQLNFQTRPEKMSNLLKHLAAALDGSFRVDKLDRLLS